MVLLNAVSETTPTKRRIPWLAALLSLLIPGLGQLYNGEPARMAKLLIALALANSACLYGLRTSLRIAVPLILLGFSIQILAIFDAYVDARRKQQFVLRPYNHWLTYSIFGAVLALAIGSAVDFAKENYVQAFRIPSSSMSPTVQVGDNFVVDMAWYRGHSPVRGDVVIAYSPDGASQDGSNVVVLKRVVALGGDTVEIKGPALFVNGQREERPNVSWREGGRMDYPLTTVPAGQLFLLGDNRDFSKDSRHWSPPFVSPSAVRGKVLFVYYPFNRAGVTIE